MSHSPQSLIRKIEALSAERLHEVENFVDFIAAREQDDAMTFAAGKVSAPAFAEVWNNPEDDVYDAL